MPHPIRIGLLAPFLFCLNIGAEETPSPAQLIHALQDPNLRQGAAIALVKFGQPVVPALQESLASDMPDVRVWSAYTLGEIGPQASYAVSSLTQCLKTADPALRSAAAEALGKMGPSAASSVSLLAELLADKQAEVRQHAAVALGRIGEQAGPAVPQLIAAMKDPHVRPLAKAALIQIGQTTSASLQASLNDDGLRFDVSAILLTVHPKLAKQSSLDQPTLADLKTLQLALLDASRPHTEHKTAAVALTALGKEGFEVLIEGFSRPDIAEIAATAFADADTSCVSPLIQALNHSHPLVRSSAAAALGHVGPKADESVPSLRKLLKDTDINVRHQAVLALASFGTKSSPALDDLIQIIMDPRQQEATRQWAIIALVDTLPDTQDAVVQALIQAVQTKENFGVSSLARQHLLRVDPQAAEAAGIR